MIKELYKMNIDVTELSINAISDAIAYILVNFEKLIIYIWQKIIIPFISVIVTIFSYILVIPFFLFFLPFTVVVYINNLIEKRSKKSKIIK